MSGRNEKDSRDWRELKANRRKQKQEELLTSLGNVKSDEHNSPAKHLKLSSENAGRQYTISIALPGSILDNAQSLELRTYLVGQIARAAVVFSIDEIIVFDESGMMTKDPNLSATSAKVQANIQMIHILQYLECPQYLRKTLFPRHKNLQFAGLLNPLDSPHHMRRDSDCEFREGVVLDKPVQHGHGSYVDVGLTKEVQLDRKLVPGVRVTVQLEPLTKGSFGKMRQGIAVSCSMPSTKSGLYWGYRARLASSLGAVFSDSPYEGGYDLTIGTSERGKSVDNFALPKFRHMLVVFGGLHGLEASLDADSELDAEDPSELFHHYLNTCPGQGSRTIRTEEAILITLSALRMKLASLTTVL